MINIALGACDEVSRFLAWDYLKQECLAFSSPTYFGIQLSVLPNVTKLQEETIAGEIVDKRGER